MIHKEWGFFGSISLRSVYYDKETRKVTLTDWGSTRLPIKYVDTDYYN